MRSTFTISALLVIAAAPLAAQQRTQVYSITPRATIVRTSSDDTPHAVIGINTGGGLTARDTLGLLVSDVTPDSPAEKAGLEEGDRIASVNGHSLRLAAADVGDAEMRGIMQRRLVREMSGVKPGDEVELKVWSGGQWKTLRVKTVASDSLYPEQKRLTSDEWRAQAEDRPVLGIGLGDGSSKRDTLGVFVTSVVDSGPADRAGVQEGMRIASINGVDVRVSRADAGDAEVASAKAQRLDREIAKLKPGADAELRVYADGQYRTLHVKIGRAGDLPKREGSFFFNGDGWAMPPMPAMAPMPAMPAMPKMMPSMSPMIIRMNPTVHFDEDADIEMVQGAMRAARAATVDASRAAAKSARDAARIARTRVMSRISI